MKPYQTHCDDMIISFLDRGSACVRVVAVVGEPYPVCGAAEAGSAVLSSPSHTQRPVSGPFSHISY